MGYDVVGIVSLTGPACSHVQPSTPVWGLAPGSLRTFTQCDARYVSQMPSALAFDLAVTLPVVWTTARYCAMEAQFGAKQTVLIHAASGGVGLVSIDWVHRLRGAAHATAGAISKHCLLHSHGVFADSSRSAPTCASQLACRLCGYRVHSVVNSLSKDFISLTFALMAQDGAFLEIGKNNIWSQTRATAAQPMVDYVAVAVDEGCRNCTGWNADPYWFNQQLRQLLDAVRSEEVMPLPQQTFALEAVQDAFKLLQRGGNLGKVALCVTSSRPTEISILAAESLDDRELERGMDLGTRVRLSLDESVALLELNDAQRGNTLSAALGDDMRLAVNYLLSRSDTIRAVVLQGAGRVFCAGGNPYDYGPELAATARGMMKTVEGVMSPRRLPVPIACAVHGAMVGGASAIFFHSDVRVAEASATFQHGNLSRGVCPIAGYSRTLQGAIGSPLAFQFYLTDQVIAAPSALALGIVHIMRMGRDETQAYAHYWAGCLANFASARHYLSMRCELDMSLLVEEGVDHVECPHSNGGMILTTTHTPESGGVMHALRSANAMHALEPWDAATGSQQTHPRVSSNAPAHVPIVMGELEPVQAAMASGLQTTTLSALHSQLVKAQPLLAVCPSGAGSVRLLSMCRASAVIAHVDSTFSYSDDCGGLPDTAITPAKQSLTRLVSMGMLSVGKPISARVACRLGLVESVHAGFEAIGAEFVRLRSILGKNNAALVGGSSMRTVFNVRGAAFGHKPPDITFDAQHGVAKVKIWDSFSPAKLLSSLLEVVRRLSMLRPALRAIVLADCSNTRSVCATSGSTCTMSCLAEVVELLHALEVPLLITTSLQKGGLTSSHGLLAIIGHHHVVTELPTYAYAVAESTTNSLRLGLINELSGDSQVLQLAKQMAHHPSIGFAHMRQLSQPGQPAHQASGNASLAKLLSCTKAEARALLRQQNACTVRVAANAAKISKAACRGRGSHPPLSFFTQVRAPNRQHEGACGTSGAAAAGIHAIEIYAPT
eukprot:5344621-Prymnesium_polylepis.1